MTGLLVLGCTLAGACAGGGAGMVAMMFLGSMEPGDLSAAMYPLGGIALGGLVGAYVGGLLV